jgi:hypothetical protein
MLGHLHGIWSMAFPAHTLHPSQAVVFINVSLDLCLITILALGILEAGYMVFIDVSM